MAEQDTVRPGVTALVLAGGRGTRMGGLDKGLQPFKGRPLVLHALDRLRQQTQEPAAYLVNANRNPEQYASFDVPVCADTLTDFPGPLAGFLAGLQHCRTEWLLAVPCDTPLFPLDLLARMLHAAEHSGANLCIAQGQDETGEQRRQPVFCLMRRSLLPSLEGYLATGGRKIDTWCQNQRATVAVFDKPADDPRAFFNANTLEELRHLEAG